MHSRNELVEKYTVINKEQYLMLIRFTNKEMETKGEKL